MEKGIEKVLKTEARLDESVKIADVQICDSEGVASAWRIAMAARRSRWTGIGIVILILAVIECIYRLAFWLSMGTLPHANPHSASRAHFWLSAAVIAGSALIYLTWHNFQAPRIPAKKSSKKNPATAR